MEKNLQKIAEIKQYILDYHDNENGNYNDNDNDNGNDHGNGNDIIIY